MKTQGRLIAATIPLFAYLLASLLRLAPALAAMPDEPIQSFYGVYEGASISRADQGLGKRDLGVAIQPREKGFNVTWTTVSYTGEGEEKRKTYSIDFDPTGKQGIYGSAMRRDMFGNRVPLNPLQGDPFIWATIRGKTLTVYALMITADGGYELQTYERTLENDGGLHLEFSRIRNGVPLKFITGTLRRVD